MFANPEQAFGGTTRLLALIESIYGAVGNASLWPGILDQITDAVHGEQTLFFNSFPDPEISNALCCLHTHPEVLDSFTSYYAGVNVLAEPCDQMFPTGSVRYSHWAVPDVEFERTEFYNDFFRPLDMHYSFGLKIPLGDQSPAYLSTQRAKVKGPFGDMEGVVLQTLMPHLKRALELHLKFARTQSNRVGLEKALDAFDHAVFGLDGQGCVLVSNRHAEALAQARDGVCVTNGTLSAIFPNQNTLLQKLLSDAVSTGAGMGHSTGGAFLLQRSSGKPPLRVTVTPFLSPLSGTSSHLAALVFLSDPLARQRSRAVTLRALYALTPSEARVADLLLDGLVIQEVANALGLTLETARFHTKRVLAKTGTKRQSELMKLMLTLPAVS